MIGELRLVASVPDAYAELARSTARARLEGQGLDVAVVLGCSGGGSGKACALALAASDFPFSRTEVLFADERCVDPSSPDANQRVIGEAFAAHREDLVGFHPMACAQGPLAYEALLRRLGRIDLLQLGLGPDGHTASLFANSPGLATRHGELVTENEDPSGQNPYMRLSLTLDGIALAHLAVFCVMGADKAEVMRALVDGADLPTARVRADEVLWLVDPQASVHLA